MPISRFFEVLPCLRDNQGVQVGVCAMGPIGTGDRLIWMRVWVWQQDGNVVIASSGNSGDHVHGAHPLKGDQMPPFAAPETQWMVQTGFEPTSGQEYDVGKPALAQALALVERDGEQAIVQWSQAVALRLPYHHPPGGGAGGPGGEPGDEHEDHPA
jgi:hypothetical protein